MNRTPLPPFTGKHYDELRLFQRCRVNADVKAVQNALKRDGRKQVENNASAHRRLFARTL